MRQLARDVAVAPVRLRFSVRPISRYSQYIAHPDRVPPLWIVMPLGVENTLKTVPAWGLGRRQLYLPADSMVCCTWREAMDYATTGQCPCPVAERYPEWCGI